MKSSRDATLRWAGLYPNRTFCLREEGPRISVVVTAPGGAVEVRLHLELTHPGPWLDRFDFSSHLSHRE